MEGGGWRDRGGGRMVIVYNYSYKNKQDYPMLHETKQLDPLSTHPVPLYTETVTSGMVTMWRHVMYQGLRVLASKVNSSLTCTMTIVTKLNAKNLWSEWRSLILLSQRDLLNNVGYQSRVSHYFECRASCESCKCTVALPTILSTVIDFK